MAKRPAAGATAKVAVLSKLLEGLRRAPEEDLFRGEGEEGSVMVMIVGLRVCLAVQGREDVRKGRGGAVVCVYVYVGGWMWVYGVCEGNVNVKHTCVGGGRGKGEKEWIKNEDRPCSPLDHLFWLITDLARCWHNFC